MCFSFLSTFVCCCSFFTCSSSLISYPGFVFGFLWRTMILSQSNFTPALISSFCFVMLPIGIFGNNWSTFLVSTLTICQFRSLRDGNVVLFSVMIFFINSTFILSSVIICFVLLGICYVLVFNTLHFNLVGNSCFSVFSISIFLGGILSLFTCPHICSISGPKTNLSLISF